MKQQETKQTILTGTVLTRAIVYARVSGDDSKYSTSGIESQLADCRKYAESKGYNVVQEFFEEPDRQTSGADWLPELQKILKLAEQGAFDVLVVREIDRLARNRFKQMSVENHLEAHGVQVEYVIGQYADTSEGRLLKGLMSEFAQYERDKIRERTQRGVTRAIKAGKIPQLGLTYGYDIEDGQMIVNDYEAGIVQAIFDRYVNKRQSLSQIAEWLSDCKVEKPGKRACHQSNIIAGRDTSQWAHSQVSAILENETYIGRWHYRKTRTIKNPKTGGTKRLKRPKSEWLTVEVPAIVNEKIFQAAQERKEENKRQIGKNRKHKYLVGGMVTCGNCKKFVTGTTNNRHQYYRCGVNHLPKRFGLTCENVRVFRVDVVDSIVWNWIKPILLNEENLEREIDKYQETQREDQGPLLRMIETNEAKLAEAEARLQRLSDGYLAGAYQLDEFVKEKEPIDKDIAGLKRGIDSLRAELKPVLLSDEEVRTIKEFAAEIRKGIMQAEKETEFKVRRAVLQALRTQVVLSLIDDRKMVKITCVLGETEISTDYSKAGVTITVSPVEENLC